MTAFELSSRFFLQLAVILLVCRVVGWVGRRFLGQPQVVGEMIAGVVLGPSLFGALLPAWQASLFPKEGMTPLFVASQLGLALYMFLVGVEFDPALVRSRLRGALGVSVAGIVAPFALGVIIALATLGGGNLFTPTVSPVQAALFMGAAMSITAFPMLARIIHERNLARTRMGTLALAAGATDDVAAWAVLAVVLATFKDDPSIAGWAIGGGVLYVATVYFVGQPLLRSLAAASERRPENGTPLVLTLTLLMLGSWFTDLIGLYAVFGAFVLGAAMPKNGEFARRLRSGLEPVTTYLLLPLFFVFSGLNTKLGLVNTPALWALTSVILAAAVLGKGGACYLAARVSGEGHDEAFGIGTLMNARGLMELIILNIGLQRGVITPTLFTIMVIMAIVTTMMAGPIFEVAQARRAAAARRLVPTTAAEPAAGEQKPMAAV